jgi:hypothetical protein
VPTRKHSLRIANQISCVGSEVESDGQDDEDGKFWDPYSGTKPSIHDVLDSEDEDDDGVDEDNWLMDNQFTEKMAGLLEILDDKDADDEGWLPVSKRKEGRLTGTQFIELMC